MLEVALYKYIQGNGDRDLWFMDEDETDPTGSSEPIEEREYTEEEKLAAVQRLQEIVGKEVSGLDFIAENGFTTDDLEDEA